ncbi:alpha-amylase family protein [Cellulomonas alba]|uniref:Alpha-amylase family protein n=1 Tax=Cellulomonas alba TaxID=3053467 RepID=A0ABT7SI57_9CELL|nr:alpha-amylase family protein [Cellulomonas alba]MDM7855858.1 alpha-amylase family protein [Cellulomonas alba]
MTVPDEVAAAARAALTGASPERREVFEARLDRWWSDLRDGLAAVYPDPGPLLLELVSAAAQAYAERDPELHRLDLERTLAPDWFQRPEMLGYAAYTERFAGDLAGVADAIPYLRELGVTYLHLMPLLQPREGDNDGGYAVANYRAVRADLGTIDDLRALATRLRGAGVSLVLDLVLNHVAREHEWARLARGGSARHRAYFHVFPDREEPDAYERTLWEVFPDFAPGSFTWDDELAGWVWTTFHAWQWDLNWANPDVFAEMARVVLFLANVGVEVLRLDAIAFLWKRLGTDCQNQPEVHQLTRALHALTRIACPALIFKAEAIVGPSDLAAYLGVGPLWGKVSDLAYHNGLMVQVWSMLAAKDVRLASHALRALPHVPSSTAWVTYLRGHDDIGWAVSDADAAAVGADGGAHRSFLSDWYAGEFPTSDARGLVFQYNAATGDRRISGTTASLVGLEAARDAGDEGWVDAALARLLLGHAIVLSWGGIPVVWSGDELGLPNDPAWADEPDHADDNRWANRPRLDPAAVARLDDPTSLESRVFGGLRHLAQARAGLPHLHASVASEVLGPDDPGVLLVARRHPLGALLAAANVTGDWRPVTGDRLRELGLTASTDAITGEELAPGDDGNLWLAPWRAVWLVAR